MRCPNILELIAYVVDIILRIFKGTINVQLAILYSGFVCIKNLNLVNMPLEGWNKVDFDGISDQLIELRVDYKVHFWCESAE